MSRHEVQNRRAQVLDQLGRRLVEIRDLIHEARIFSREADLPQAVWRALTEAAAACQRQVEIEQEAAA